MSKGLALGKIGVSGQVVHVDCLPIDDRAAGSPAASNRVAVEIQRDGSAMSGIFQALGFD
jgi:hypothetical protein